MSRLCFVGEDAKALLDAAGEQPMPENLVWRIVAF